MTAGYGRRVALSAVLGLGVAVLGAAGASADGPDDFPVTVEVTGTGTPSAPTPGGASGGDRRPVGSAAGPTQGSDTTQVFAEPTDDGGVPAEDDSVDGVLAVGGLRTTFTPAANPFAGTMRVQVTVQNLSDETIEPTVEFGLTSWLGVRLSQEPARPLGSLAPGELATADAELAGVGQWTVVSAHMLLTPEPGADGSRLAPMSRDRWVVVPPWFVLGAAGLVAAGVAAWRWSTRVPADVPAVGQTA